MSGGRVGFYSDGLKTLSSDIQELQPTLFVTVPCLLNRIYHKVTIKIILNNSNNDTEKLLFNRHCHLSMIVG